MNILPNVPQLLIEICKRREHHLVTFGSHEGEGLLGFKDKTDGDAVFAVTTSVLTDWYGLTSDAHFNFMADLVAAKQGRLPKRVLDGPPKPTVN